MPSTPYARVTSSAPRMGSGVAPCSTSRPPCGGWPNEALPVRWSRRDLMEQRRSPCATGRFRDRPRLRHVPPPSVKAAQDKPGRLHHPGRVHRVVGLRLRGAYLMGRQHRTSVINLRYGLVPPRRPGRGRERNAPPRRIGEGPGVPLGPLIRRCYEHRRRKPRVTVQRRRHRLRVNRRPQITPASSPLRPL